MLTPGIGRGVVGAALWAWLSLVGVAALGGVLTFDEVKPLPRGVIPAGYSGLDWERCMLVEAAPGGNSPYQHGRTSGSNVLVGGDLDPALGTVPASVISGGGRFDLASATITAAWCNQLELQIVGSGPFGTHTMTLQLLNRQPTLLPAGVLDIDRLEFRVLGWSGPVPGLTPPAGGEAQFILDDLELNARHPAAPRVVLAPKPLSNLVNSPASLSVLAGSLEPVSYQWRRDGVDLVDGGVLSGATASLLSFARTAASDRGNYSVVLRNSGGAVTSAPVALSIYALELKTVVDLQSPHAFPTGGLVLAGDGNLYGTTQGGGVDDNGSVFRLRPNGQLDSIVAFNGGNGSHPQTTLAIGQGGKLYGTTLNGGNSQPAGLGTGFGTMFEVTTNGAFRSIYRFDGPNGALPNGLAASWTGDLYGTTQYGGPGYTAGLTGSGALFYVGAGGTVTRYDPASFSLPGSPLGLYPVSTFLKGIGSFNPNLFGLGYDQNSHPRVFFYDTIQRKDFQVDVFDSSIGFAPRGLAWGPEGWLYGVAFSGGQHGAGSIFKLSPHFAAGDNNTTTRLVSFRTDGPEGFNPMGGLTSGRDGRIYGTTWAGGAGSGGTVFQLTPDGVVTVIATFNGPNGSKPRSELLLRADGSFYGTASEGGAHGKGTIFRLEPVILGADIQTFGTVASPTGQNVAVAPIPPLNAGDPVPVQLVFDEVHGAGTTSVNITDAASLPPVPSGFVVAPNVTGVNGLAYFNISSSVFHSGNIRVCVHYNDSGLTPAEEGSLRFLHYSEAQARWVDITTSRDTASNEICGTTTSLSPFAIVLPVGSTLVVSWADPAPIVYGTPLDATQLNAVATFDSLPVPGTFTYTPPAGTVLHAGPGQALSVTFTPDNPAFGSVSAQVALDVLPAPLTIKADDKYQYFGAPFAGLSVSYSGFVNGDSPANLTSQPSVTSDAADPGALGTYPIQVFGASSPDYTITHLEGAFWIGHVGPMSGPLRSPINGRLYYLLNNSEWFSAEEGAKALGGHLVTLRNQAEQDWVYQTFSQFGGVDRHLWIGLRDADLSQNATDPMLRRSEFVWSSGEPVLFTHWSGGEPSGNRYGPADTDFEAFAHIWSPAFSRVIPSLTGLWNDGTSGTWGFGGPPDIAYSPMHGVAEVDPPGPIAGPVVNPANGHTYYLLRGSDWQAAEYGAQALGGHLVTIRGQAEQDFVFSTFAHFGGEPRDLHIGLYDPDQANNATDPVPRRSEFVWTSGEPVSYSNWVDWEPNNYQGSGEFWGNIVAFDGKWNDIGNYRGYGVVEVIPASSQPDFRAVVPTGSSVPVAPVNPADASDAAPVVLTFEQVTSPGVTTVIETADTGKPAGFTLAPVSGGPANGGILRLDIKTTATFAGKVTLCFSYDDSLLPPGSEQTLRLYHYDEAAQVWSDITTSHNPTDNRICGETDHFSVFALVISHAPTISAFTIPAGPIHPGTPIQIGATFADADPEDVHTAIVTWGDGTTSAATVDASTKTIAASHAYSQSGVYPVRIELTDLTGKSAVATGSVTVNASPVCDAGGPYKAGLAKRTLVPLNGSASTDDQPSGLTYRWQVDPAVAVFDDPTLVRPTLIVTAPPASITLQVTLTVTDALGATSSCVVPVKLTYGDVDHDGDVDRNDYNAVVAARNLVVGPTDPRDLDRDGKITVLDARKVALLYTRPGGATE